ncbi:family 43 glycosylhydrolase [uncultured Cellulomonas sp.]|uniref:family 43 glycosylhydrolase n=1 Tax=uncultured Cellulomonas sp. TaxID=189682 RepID=UPI00261E542C|nr:family 43 glycosylhydrolase [uncultured Cellulomonas sp.]
MRLLHMHRAGVRGATLATVGALVSACLVGSTLPASAADDVQLIVNGGFEAGLTDWFPNNGNADDGGTLSVVGEAFAGTGAIAITGRTTTGSGPMQDLSGELQAGGTYTVTARIRYDDAASPETKQFFATMHYGGGTYTNVGTVEATRGEWALLESTFTIPAGQDVATARLFFETPWVPPADAQAAPDLHLMDFMVDEVSLIGAAAPEPPAAPSKTIEVVGKLPGEHNPLISHKFGADGFGFVDDGRVYMYMTNDTQGYAPDPQTGISPQINYGQINQITVISSEDLVNWTDHGEIQVAGPDGVAPFTNNSWAPGMATKMVDGEQKYFLYYANGGGSSNVITGESPLGPWSSERSSTLINSSTPGAEGVNWLFDPAPFVDDDGQPYLYFGGGPAAADLPPEERFNNPKNLRAIELGDDMVSTEGSAVVVDAPVAFEAGHVFERDGRYYFSYSSHFGGPDFGGNQPRVPGYPGGGQIGYMISDDPMTWPKETYAGVLFPNQAQFFGPGTGGNNHQSVFELDGEYYFTYHAPTLNKRINGDTTQGYRSPHIQKLEFNDDGTIEPVVGTYAGPEQVRDFDPYRVIEAETIAWQQGLATTVIDAPSTQFGAGAPNLALHDVDDGDWTSLSAVDFGAGAARVTATVRPLVDGGRIRVRLDDRESAPVATVDVSGEPGQWTEVSAALAGVSGVHDVYFTVEGPTGEDLFEVDTWSFEAAEDAGPTSPVFVDVQPGAAFYSDIRWLADNGLSLGTQVGEDTWFYPASAMSRQAMAAFLYRYAGAGWTPAPGTQTFSDVPVDHQFYDAVEWMKAEGLADGYADGTFGATRPVSRQAMAAFLHRLAGEPDAAAPVTFSDVTDAAPFAEAIAWLESADIAEGYPDGTFGTTRPVTRQAMAAFLHRYDAFLSDARNALG